MNLAERIEAFQRARGRRELLDEQLSTARQQSVDLKTEQANLELAQAFIQKIARETQEQLRFQIVDIVQLALDTCFEDQYQFTIDFDTQKGHTTATLSFSKDGKSVDPMTASGGGVVDMAAFALRIAAWSLGHTDNVVVLDEPFRFVSVDLRPQAAKLVEELSHRLKLQYIIVTHDSTIVDVADRVFEVQLKPSGVSKVTVRFA